jgi:hypothetical protein
MYQFVHVLHSDVLNAKQWLGYSSSVANCTFRYHVSVLQKMENTAISVSSGIIMLLVIHDYNS